MLNKAKYYIRARKGSSLWGKQLLQAWTPLDISILVMLGSQADQLIFVVEMLMAQLFLVLFVSLEQDQSAQGFEAASTRPHLEDPAKELFHILHLYINITLTNTDHKVTYSS